MKQNSKKKIKGLFLASSLATCGCSVNVANAGGVESVVIGLTVGAFAAYMAPGWIESKIYSEIDKAIDDKKFSEKLSIKLKNELKRQIKEKIKKDGLWETVWSIRRIAKSLEKIDNQNIIGKLTTINNDISREGFDICSIIGEICEGKAQDVLDFLKPKGFNFNFNFLNS